MIFHSHPQRMNAANRVAAEQAKPATAVAGLAPATSGVPPGGGRRAATQRGGTFLGIILGVMAGLAVALGVAIYVAKVPVPFVNKSTSRSTGQDAAEAERNRAWDPNATLRNRGAQPAPPPSASVAPAPEPAPIPPPAETARAPERTPAPAEVKPAEVKPAEPKVASKPAEPRAPASSSDPLGDFAAARASARPTAPAPAPATAAVDPFTYFVQAGAFRGHEEAEAQRARLSLMGVEARVTEREQSGRTVYRVRVGPFQNKDAADRIKDRLDDNGFDSALVRVQR